MVTASERATRFLTARFHRGRRQQGLTAWPAPSILDWQSFLRKTWDERVSDGRMVLNSLQEQSLWAQIVSESAPAAVELAGAADRLAVLATEAHHRLCAYAPQLLRDGARVGWDRDAGVFSLWLAAFNRICREGKLVSAARLALELCEPLKTDCTERPHLLLAGFDRILPVQQSFFAAWGNRDCVREISLDAAAAQVQFHAAPDPSLELAACALWAKAQLAANPHARLLVITQDARNRRGEIERAFHRYCTVGKNASAAASLIEFSLGVPLGQAAIARAAQLILRWLGGAIAENELDWLLATSRMAATPAEARSLLAFMRALRRKGLQRPRWTLAAFLHQRPNANLPPEWVRHITRAQQHLQESARRLQSPLVWAELVPHLLEITGWPGAARPGGLTSAEYQVLRRWQQTVDECASLGFDGRRIAWSDFLEILDRTVSETLFAPESVEAPILIAGPAESAGLTADAVWFLGASEDAWPSPGAAHPFLPIGVQRQAGMPHASPRLDWELAGVMTRRLLASAPAFHFSYAQQSEGVEARPSRIVTQLAVEPQPLPAELVAPPAPEPLTVCFEDAIQIPYLKSRISGGSRILTAQSQCAFQAFAVARLGAEKWSPAEAGLSASERGLLLHGVLHSIWSGPPDGIRSHGELCQKIDRIESFAQDHVRRVVKKAMPVRAHDCMPVRYVELEATRLTRLVSEWLRYEAARAPFTVAETEYDAHPSIAGIEIKVRLDRIDRLSDDSLLVIDYKSGLVSPKSWDLPRPDDVQLPLYACFALPDAPESAGGLVFAQIRAGKDKEFSGCVRNARDTLMSSLSAQNALVKKPLSDSDLAAWREYIEKMARDFLLGKAEAAPRNYPKTCERCGLDGLCRIREHPPQLDGDLDDDEETANA